MKIKALLLAVCCSIMTVAFADANHHSYPNMENQQPELSVKPVQYPGYCEIEIINQSYQDVRVYGVFDDGTSLVPFNVYAFEAPHYISLYYYGYCHAWMDLDIDTLWSGRHLYSGYTRVGSSISVVPYLEQQPKAVLSIK